MVVVYYVCVDEFGLFMKVIICVFDFGDDEEINEDVLDIKKFKLVEVVLVYVLIIYIKLKE